MTSVVADTHALVWYISNSEKLSESALAALDVAINTGNTIYISAISLVEIIYLVEKKRLTEEVLTRVINILENPDFSILLIPLDQDISVSISKIDRVIVSDMPDRVIAATALHLNLPLVTRDLKIRSLTNLETIW